MNKALIEMEKIDFDQGIIRKWAEKFASDRFVREIKQLMFRLLNNKKDGTKKID